jgi:hypothetical protein
MLVRLEHILWRLFLRLQRCWVIPRKHGGAWHPRTPQSGHAWPLTSLSLCSEWKQTNELDEILQHRVASLLHLIVYCLRYAKGIWFSRFRKLTYSRWKRARSLRFHPGLDHLPIELCHFGSHPSAAMGSTPASICQVTLWSRLSYCIHSCQLGEILFSCSLWWRPFQRYRLVDCQASLCLHVRFAGESSHA